MTIQTGNLRLHLTFFDELMHVQIIGAVNHMGASFRKMGFVAGKEPLLELLEKAGIDHYIICSGDIFMGDFKAVAFEQSPKAIVETLQKGFRRANELESKILDGGELTDEERSFAVPTTLWVCSSSVKTDEGLKRVSDWFRTAAPDSAAKPSALA